MLPMGREVWGRLGAPKSYLGLDLKVCDWIRIWVKLESYRLGRCHDDPWSCADVLTCSSKPRLNFSVLQSVSILSHACCCTEKLFSSVPESC